MRAGCKVGEWGGGELDRGVGEGEMRKDEKEVRSRRCDGEAEMKKGRSEREEREAERGKGRTEQERRKEREGRRGRK